MADKDDMTQEPQVDTVVEDTPAEEPESTDQSDTAQEEEKVEEQKEEPEVDVKATIRRFTKAELLAEVNDLQEDMDVLTSKVQEKDSEIASLKAEIEKYKADLQAKEDVAEKYTSIVQEVIQEKKNNVPQEIQELLPEGLSVEQQLAWLTKAQNTGNLMKKEAPAVEIGKPMNMGVPQQSTADMTPHQKLSSYFATVFK